MVLGQEIHGYQGKRNSGNLVVHTYPPGQIPLKHCRLSNTSSALSSSAIEEQDVL
jgi:hypothetical protein